MPGPVANLPQSITAAINNISTTETVLENIFIGSTVESSDTYVMEGFGSCISSMGNLSTFAVRVGTTGTLADAVVGTTTCVAGTTTGTTSIGFYFRIMVTFRTVGLSGTVMVNGKIDTTTTSGIVSTNVVAVSANSTPTTIATNLANYLSLSYKSAGTTTTCTFQNVSISKVK